MAAIKHAYKSTGRSKRRSPAPTATASTRSVALLDPDYPISQGLRPFRRQNVRVERELRPVVGESLTKHSRIIHTYGHVGAGWSLSFGCAADVLAMVEEALLDKAPTAMQTEKGFTPKHEEAHGRFSARL